MIIRIHDKDLLPVPNNAVGTSAGLFITRRTAASLIYACLVMLEKPEINYQSVGEENGELGIVIIDQDTHSSPTDAAKIECREFIEQMKRVRILHD